MNPQINNIEKIIMYLDGDFTSKEIDDFEEQLFYDNSLIEDFIYIKEIEDSLRDTNIEEFKQSLRRVHMAFIEYEYVQNKIDNMKFIVPISRWYHKLYRVAAVFIVIVGLSFILAQILSEHPTRTEKIFSEYYQPFQKNPVRSIGNHAKNLHLAFDAYDNKQYEVAINYFDKVLTVDSTILFYKGISSVECGRYNMALVSFNQLMGDSTNPYYTHSVWYIALTWLKLNKPENAKPHLKWLIKNDRYYSKKASLILKELGDK